MACADRLTGNHAVTVAHVAAGIPAALPCVPARPLRLAIG